MFKKALIAALCSTVIATSAFAHCQIPCGIYGDEGRFDALREDFSTIEKSMNQINEMSKAGDKNYNQLVRWVSNKDDHAQKVQQVVLDYFLAQRIKPDTENYDKKLMHLHHLVVKAMKCKQTTDTGHVEGLRKHLDDFEALYFGKVEKKEATGHEGHNHK